MTAAPTILVLAAIAGAVELRGGAGVIDEPVAGVSVAGVRLEGDAPRTISWDRVRAVDGPVAADAARFLDIADRAWRARARLARADIALSEPLFESLFDEVVRAHGEASGPTGLVIADGLLRCRIARSQAAQAVEPWLWAARLAPAGADSSIAIDARTLLCPDLPPVFLASNVTAALAESESVRRLAEHRSPAGELAAWTLYAARSESGLSAEPPGATEFASHPGVALVRAMTLARAGDAVVRAAAREELAQGLAADAGTWREAWRRAAIGRSLLMEAGETDRARGVVHLLHVPARFAATQPVLASVALAEAVAELRRTGDLDAAHSLTMELRARDPRGAALRWLESPSTRNPSADAAVAPRPANAKP